MAFETYILVERDRQQDVIKKEITCVLRGDKNYEEMFNGIRDVECPVVGRVKKKDGLESLTGWTWGALLRR